MKIQAFILILPFTIFLIETVSFIPALQEACTIITSQERPCCMMTDETAKNACSSKDTGGEESSENDCAQNSNCTTCPVCYSFILQRQYEWPVQAFVFDKNYASLKSTYSSLYICNVWKPLNGFFIYS